MPNPLDLPVYLFQVLEEEYLTLHGQLQEEILINLQGRRIMSRRDWRFHAGHVKKLAGLKNKLSDTSHKLSQHLLKKMPAEDMAEWKKEHARKWLDELLDKELYDEEQFKHVPLSETTQKLIELARRGEATLDERRHINRLLLEDVYPDHLEKVHDIRLTAMHQCLHEKRQAALCFSGGGIRSGTFALGLLQGLARHNLLKHFDYLSTVSGGGYIGGWLSAWIQRHPRGLPGVTDDLRNVEPRSKIDPDPPAIRHLREYSNFITPKVGLLSADAWTFITIYLRNLLLNWFIIIPLILSVLLFPRLSVAFVRAMPTANIANIEGFGYTFPFGHRHLFLVAGFALTAWAIAYVCFSRPVFRTRLIDRNPYWKERTGQRGFLRHCLVPLAVAASLLTTYWAWTPEKKSWWQFLLFGLLVTAAGWLLATYILRQYRKETWRENIGFEPLLLLAAGAAGGLLARAATGLLPVRELTKTKVDCQWVTELYACLALPLFLLMVLLGVTLFAGISSHLTKKVDDEDREWWARFSSWVVITALAWSVFSGLVIFGPLVLLAAPKLISAVGGISGLVAVLLGRSAKTSATAEGTSQGGWKAQLSSQLLPLLAMIFLAVFVAALSLLTSILITFLSNNLAVWTDSFIKPPWVEELNAPFEGGIGELFFLGGGQWVYVRGQAIPAYIEHLRAVHYPHWWFILVLVVVLGVIGVGLSRAINLNLFSLHGAYRNRLIRGFLAASRNRLLRRPNPFTGFDPADNISMHELRPALLHEPDFKDITHFAGTLKGAGQTWEERESGAGLKAAAKRQKRSPAEDGQTASGPAEFIYTQLTDKGKVAVNSYDGSAPLSQQHRADLREDLNRILEETDLYAEPAFKPVLREPQAKSRLTGLGYEPQYPLHRSRIALEEAFREDIGKAAYPPHRLLHVINTALNLVGGDNLAWQQRKAASFTVSPLHSGSHRVGYRRSRDYGGEDGISLGTAAAISGAAASSNMGYYTSSPVLSLVMTLFNVRLGWWLGNPGPAGSHHYRGLASGEGPDSTAKRIYRRRSPRFSLGPVLVEAFGMTDDRSNYVYLSDGGHFENLALYEMVLRRCNVIVVSDGAADAGYRFNDLANAVRKIRIDLGIPITFPDVPIYSEAPTKDGEGGSYWAIGVIGYSEIDRLADGKKAEDGLLLYIKPAVYGDEPEDVVHYKRAHPTFPNETTADQFFDEPQFESYRALGFHVMNQICGARSGDLDLDQFFDRAFENLLKIAPQMRGKYQTPLDD